MDTTVPQPEDGRNIDTIPVPEGYSPECAAAYRAGWVMGGLRLALRNAASVLEIEASGLQQCDAQYTHEELLARIERAADKLAGLAAELRFAAQQGEAQR